MPCYHPLIRDKLNNKILPYSEHIDTNRPDYQLIPCGHCIGCRLEYSRQWAIRCQLESKVHPDNKWFVTLTYDDEHLPSDYSLNRLDLHRFIDNLRHNYSCIRYFACGEYGETFGRPHYHLIMWNLPLNDLEFARKSKNGLNLYQSPWLNEKWSRGQVLVGEVNWETSAYVARYVTKKHTKEQNEELNRENEFVVMSRKPGIGAEYYEKYKDKIYKNDSIIVLTSKSNPSVVKPPKYFDRLYKLQNESKLEKLKAVREKSARNSDRLVCSRSSLDRTDLLHVQENIVQEKIKCLTRPVEI